MSSVLRKLTQVGFALLALLGVLVLLLALEATGGHDGWLCEWGYDSDGAGGITSGCG